MISSTLAGEVNKNHHFLKKQKTLFSQKYPHKGVKLMKFGPLLKFSLILWDALSWPNFSWPNPLLA
jgi:hypothetical protein